MKKCITIDFCYQVDRAPAEQGVILPVNNVRVLVMQYDLAVVIGRFQPCHQAHVHMIESALAVADRVLVLVGSSHRARTTKNPFSFTERAAFLQQLFPERVVIEPLEDQMYDEMRWVETVKAYAKQYCDSDKITLVGHDKDDSTYYLQYFPDWNWVKLDNYHNIDATPIRQAYLLGEDLSAFQAVLPEVVQEFLRQFAQGPEYARLAEECAFIQRYKAEWANTPYPVLFVTTDSVVTCQQHVLLVQRKFQPGRALWALPGGFLEANEWVWQGLIRELKEETSIAVPDETLKASLKATQVFDRPGRSQIGRVITHGGWFDLPLEALPSVEAADDALAVQWLPLDQVDQLKTQLHDDHYFIIREFLFKK